MISKHTMIAGLFVALSAISAHAQRFFHKDRHEIGVFAGATNYQGDLEENPVNFSNTQAGIGAFYRYNFSHSFSIRFGGDYGVIEDYDNMAKSQWRQQRNLSVHTPIYDFYLVPEFNFINLEIGRRRFFTAYAFAGVGVFHFNPQAMFQGQWYDLQPLGTEGQGMTGYYARLPYARTQMHMPFGLGFAYNITPTLKLGLETRLNMTNTDYLDDVSTTYVDKDQLRAIKGPVAAALSDRTFELRIDKVRKEDELRGNPKTNDWFFFTGATLSYTFTKRAACYKF